jgi:hypothetical protein
MGIDDKTIESWQRLEEAMSGVNRVYGPTIKQLQDGAAAESRLAKERIALLGPAATFDEQRDVKLKELLSSLRDNTLSENNYNRAVAATNLEFTSQALSSRISMLGELATVSEVAKQKELEIQQANTRGAGIDSTRAASVKALAVSKKYESDLSTLSGLGAASPADIEAQRQRELNAVTQAYTLTADQQAAALTALTRKYRDLADNTEIAGSKLQDLKRFELDASNTSKQLDQLTAGAMNSLVTGLADITTGAKTAKQGFADLGNQVIRSIEEMIIRMTVAMPIARALQVALSPLLPTAGSVSGMPNLLPSGVGTIGMHHAGGIVGSESTSMRLLDLALFGHARRFHAGGIAGDEVPIIARSGEGVFTPGQMQALGRGMGNNVQIHMHHDGTTADVKQSTDANGQMRLDIMVKSLVDDRMTAAASDRGHPFTKRLSRTLGVNPAGSIG